MLSGVTSVNAMGLVVTYMMSFGLVILKKNKLVTWLTNLSSIYATHNNELTKFLFNVFAIERKYKAVFQLCLYLVYLRCVDFGCDVTYKNWSKSTSKQAEIDQDTDDAKNENNLAYKLLDFMDYIFYLLLLFSGPVFTMKDFVHGDKNGVKNKVNISKMEILKYVLSTLFYVLLLDQVVFKYTSTLIRHPFFSIRWF